MQILIDKLKNIYGGKVLDVATGRGSFIQYLTEGFKDFESIIAIDNIDETILEQASKNFEDKRIGFKRMDASKMDFTNESFDTVCLSNSLHHLKDMDAVLSEMLRVLKPDGTLIINEMICDNQSPTQMTHVLMHHWWAKIDTFTGKLHYETLPKQKILDIVKGMGINDFEVLEFADSDDPMDKESLESISKIIDEYIERAKPMKDYEAIKQEGEEIRKRLFEIGFNGATQVILIGKK
ncbi:MAG: class I SAM-dependent methyltransferase [Lutisporaceae bacterium]